MKPFGPIFIAFVILARLQAQESQSPTATETAEAKPAAPATNPADVGTPGKKPVIEKGMAAADLLKAYGKPYQKKKVKSADKELKAEQWIYRKKISERSESVLDATNVMTDRQTVMDPDGKLRTITVERHMPAQTMKFITLYQYTALLMVDGKVHLARQWREEDVSY